MTGRRPAARATHQPLPATGPPHAGMCTHCLTPDRVNLPPGYWRCCWNPTWCLCPEEKR